MNNKLILILGGARSGKSSFAEQLAGELGPEVLYVATATVGDDEMRERVSRHRERRPSAWRTLEAPTGVAAALREEIGAANVVLLDCLSVLVSNVLLQNEDGTGGDVLSATTATKVEEAVRREVDSLLAYWRESTASFVVVSNEVGLSVVPAYPLGRIYRDLLGLANQWVAQEADEVYLVVAGIPVELKALSARLDTESRRLIGRDAQESGNQ